MPVLFSQILASNPREKFDENGLLYLSVSRKRIIYQKYPMNTLKLILLRFMNAGIIVVGQLECFQD